MDRQNAASIGDVDTRYGRQHPRGVRRIRHDIKFVLGDPPHDDVVNHSPALIAEVGVLRAAWPDLAKVIRQCALKLVKRLGSREAHGTEM